MPETSTYVLVERDDWLAVLVHCSHAVPIIL